MAATDAHDLPLQDVEIDLLLDGIFRRYHHDFRGYARATVTRRIEAARAALSMPSITAMLDRVLRDEHAFSRLLSHLTIQVSELFRDPAFWEGLGRHVIPHLSTHARPRVWVAGCGAGEEAYTIAILLHEAGLLERTQIYATDIDASSLERADAGVYELEQVRRYSANYFRAGGRASLSDYYETSRSGAHFAPFLRRRILFADHSLATDSEFAEVQLITCRNVLIYFDRALQERALGLFASALCGRGFLGLGSHEDLRGAGAADRFEAVDRGLRLYRLKGAA
jgi:chemotaxis protein methyltransferase CheR